jgi:Flp pilus assembly protein TadG
VSRAPAPDRGAAAVEFALVAPLLLVLLLGIVEFGRAYGVEAALSQAAREGARALALGEPAAAARASARAAAPSLTLVDADIAVTPGTCLGTAASTTATVTVTQRFVFLSGLFGNALTLTGRSAMRCQG